MFEASPKPRVFGMPLGVDFPAALVSGILQCLKGQPPEALARVEIYVNTTRMQRRIKRLFLDQGAILPPRLHLLTDLTHNLQFEIPRATDGLGRRLQLAQLVRALIEQQPDLAAKDTAFDLADTLAELLDELQDEAVSLDDIAALDVSDHSDHWKRSQDFINLVAPYLNAETEFDSQGRMRAVVTALEAQWQVNPPNHPILVAGSTGSRGTTRAFMNAVAQLPQGAIVLPGVDFDMEPDVWDQLDEEEAIEDHPQFRCKRFLQDVQLEAADLLPWDPDATPTSPERNALVSLALRPAPVTDAWLEEGPHLQNLSDATQNVTLLEAPTTRLETLAIAMRLRKAAQDGTTAALITPDQTLARRVTAALTKWDITPNDSAGARLDLSPPGRLLRQTARLLGKPVTPDSLLALLKHPLVWADDRKSHLAKARHLELKTLRGGPAHLTKEHLTKWAETREVDDPGTVDWVEWLWSILHHLCEATTQDLSSLIALHVSETERLTQGPALGDTLHLWEKRAGEAVQTTMNNIAEASQSAGLYSPTEYCDVLDAVLAREEVRDPFFTHPDIMIWGTLEARVQGADLVILAGLNDGTWPAMPPPDPWLSRDMRRQAGLPVPEGKIGLSAHDFQQAIAAPEVWITRSVRDAEAETVPSRWLNRIQNLLNGLSPDGPAAVDAMKARGKTWVQRAQAFDSPRIKLDKAPRPAPQPPVDARPKELWVTHIETLIRDPYAIYARHVLKLRPLKPLHAEADAALRGDVIHKILQAFIARFKDELPDDAADQLRQMAADFFNRHISWPATRAFWMAKLSRAIPWFIQTEAARRMLARPEAFESDGARKIEKFEFTLKGRADRVDRDEASTIVLYDYKTGQLPTPKVQKHFNKQLPLLAAIGAANGFEGFPSSSVKQVAYIGLGSDPKQVSDTYDAGDIDQFWSQFEALIAEYMDPDKGYAARRAVYEDRWDQDYDVLSRFGEWDRTAEPVSIRVSK